MKKLSIPVSLITILTAIACGEKSSSTAENKNPQPATTVTLAPSVVPDSSAGGASVPSTPATPPVVTPPGVTLVTFSCDIALPIANMHFCYVQSGVPSTVRESLEKGCRANESTGAKVTFSLNGSCPRANLLGYCSVKQIGSGKMDSYYYAQTGMTVAAMKDLCVRGKGTWH